MHSSTSKKLSFLQKYISKHASIWYAKHGENITGVRIDKKTRGKKQKPYYAIVFNVINKKKEDELSAEHLIPKSIRIKFPDGKMRSIKTDVRQTGEFHFHARLMDPVTDQRTGEQGTLGLFLKDNENTVYALTNYHVAALGLIQDGKFSYDVTDGDPAYDVGVNGSICNLEKGAFNNEIDVAFVNLGIDAAVSNLLPDNRRIDNTAFIDGPIKPEARNKPVEVYLASRGGRLTRTVTDNSAGLNTRLMNFIELITVDRCSRPGDSGGVVLTESLKVLGIIIGADDLSTFILPYYKIRRFFTLQIL